MDDSIYIWLILLYVSSITWCHIPWRPGSWMDRIALKEDEPVAWIMLAIVVALWFI